MIVLQTGQLGAAVEFINRAIRIKPSSLMYLSLARYGIGEERIELIAAAPDWSAHMALYDRLDIALDTIPLNSKTTAFDALWMGVPLVALEGNWVGSRQASTILHALGKPEWVACNEDEYVKIVMQLARDIERRKQLRTKQRALMAASPLCDVKSLARIPESAFEAMFGQWFEKCAGKKNSVNKIGYD